jgi:hypothetical protein
MYSFLFLFNISSETECLYLFFLKKKGYSYVPYGEAWVTNSGSVLNEGHHFLAPFGKVVAVKNTHPVSMGVVSPALKTKGDFLIIFFLLLL